jgi:hypothetical protein
MKSLVTTIILIILIFSGIRAQQPLTIRGQICNCLNHSALRDCHVYVDGKVAGTISNRYGEFELQIPEKYRERSLHISHVGFETFTIPISEINGEYLEVNLEESAVLLAEIIIRPDKEEIIDTAILSVENEFRNEDELIQAFYKVLLKKDKDQRVLKRILTSEYN